MTLGQSLRQLRQGKGLVLRGVAGAVVKENGKPISPQYLHDLETDKRQPTDRTLHLIAKVLGADLDHLRALVGRAPEPVAAFCAKHPDRARAVGDLFRAIAMAKSRRDKESVIRKLAGELAA